MDSFIRIYHEKLKNIEYRMKLLQYFHSQNPEINKFEESLQNIINHIETNFKILQMKFLEAKDLSKELGILNQSIALIPELNSSKELKKKSTTPKETIELFLECDIVKSSGSYDFTPIDEGRRQSKILTAKPTFLFFGIESITIEEYKSVPKYMIGRIYLHELNNFIQVLNKTFSDKYNLLSKRKEALKGNLQKKYTDYKRLEKELKNQVEGHFLEETDIVENLDLKCLDKNSLKMLTVLRHLRRISEKRVAGKKLFIKV